MPEHYRDVPGGWYKEHDYTIRVGAVDSAEADRRFWAEIVLILRADSSGGHDWPEVRGWPEEKFFGDTEGEAFAAADEAAKAWIDGQDDARWSGNP